MGERASGLKWSGSQAAMREHYAARPGPPRKQKDAAGQWLDRRNLPKGKKARKKLRKKLQRERNQPQPERVPYSEYLLSKWWKSKRRQKLNSVGRKCNRCGSGQELQVHHLHYNTLWRENNSDLEVLCRSCHEGEHECLVQCDRHLRAINDQRY